VLKWDKISMLCSYSNTYSNRCPEERCQRHHSSDFGCTT